MQFKTNAKCAGCTLAITKKVQELFPDAKLNLDLESADKVLHVHGVLEDSEHAMKIVNAIEEAGFKGAWLDQGINNL